MGLKSKKTKLFQKRSRLEIIRDILQVIREYNNAIGPTKIQRLSNLSFQMFEEYVEELENKDLICIRLQNNNRKIYSVTDKGRALLDKCEDFESFLDDLGL
ncbi:winged helix-turn-helix domain-containing protein [uncultured Methanolobus sp.]|uniref:winged helix-turn-helix domain-containing protein n=1 Tax=uncultured Methanolobus sp. TaxID=218300 RepID=UPI002AAB261E|nr:winged helix-turn-helix domain-containing protein [uncultured Methanolobus sp.]